MKTLVLIVAAFSLLFANAVSTAGDGPPAKRSPAKAKDDPDAQKVDVLFVNGSKVIMSVLEEKIEIETGEFIVPGRPGWGANIVEAEVAKHPLKAHARPEFLSAMAGE